MQRLFSPDEVRAYDSSSMNVAACPTSEEMGSCHADDANDSVDGIRVVRNLSLNYFRGRLVEHFDIMFKEGKITWPRSRGKQPDSSADQHV
jgi:hypothetical protein